MQAQSQRQTTLGAVTSFFSLLYHTIVRNIRSASGNAALGILAVLARVAVMLAIFYVMFSVLGLRGSAIRGDFILYLLSGILLFLFQNATMSAVISAANPVSPLMLHARMTPMLNVLGAACAQLYLHTLATILILFFVYFKNDKLELYDPKGMAFVFLLTWGVGITIGLVLTILQPFFPRLTQIVSLLYQRSNMITSGKFFVANAVSYKLLVFMSWNPLFHSIDQMRGYTFVNYFPHKSNLEYPMTFVAVALMIGLLGQFWLARNLSLSTSARR